MRNARVSCRTAPNTSSTRQYYDVASVALNPAGMAAVLKLWPSTQITYGSDAPFGSTTSIVEGAAEARPRPGALAGDPPRQRAAFVPAFRLKRISRMRVCGCGKTLSLAAARLARYVSTRFRVRNRRLSLWI